jgi:hypothetical protein
VLWRRSRRIGGGDGDDDGASMDMTSSGSDSSGGRASDGGREGGSLSDGEGRNKGVFGECRGGEGDDEERLVVSKSVKTGLYHTIRMHTGRRKEGRHEMIDTPVEMVPVAGADREDHACTRQDDRQSNFLRALPRRRLGAT